MAHRLEPEADARETTRSALADAARALIERLAAGDRDEPARDALLLRIARWQAEHVVPFRRLVEARGVRPNDVTTPDELPALPTDVFRLARVAAHPPELDQRVFLTSGTTAGTRGAHPLRDLSLYDAAARAHAKRFLFPDERRIRLVSLVAPEEEAPESSLGHMVSRFHDWFGTRASAYAWSERQLDPSALANALDDALRAAEPVGLLGTSFAFVFAEDALGARRFALPAGSRIMHTGGFKGRTREVEPSAMRALLSARYGVPEPFVLQEYGMTELSSQMYEPSLAAALAGGASGPSRFIAPGWVRLVVTDPDTLRPVAGDAVGLLRIEDVANVDTAWAIQTSDLARRVADGVVVLGRPAGAVPRGCSLAVEEALAPGSAR